MCEKENGRETGERAKKYDVRAIRFAKRTVDNEKDIADYNYACLGHFDYLKVDRLEGTTPLKAIAEDRDAQVDKEDNYIYPLYILRECKEQSSETSFWQEDYSFMLVVRLHSDMDGAGEDSEEHEKMLSEILKEKYDEYCGAEDVKDEEKTAYDAKECLFYDSLELGDTVAIIKSNSLTTALKVSKFLNRIPFVRDAYTYCTIRKELLKNEPTPDLFSKTAYLSHITTRFSIRKLDKANRFFENNLAINCASPTKVFFITGTTDAMINWGRCSEEVFISNMRKLMNASAIDVEESFNAVITRVGIDFWDKAEPKKVRSDRVDEEFETCIKNVKSNWNKGDEKTPYQWRQPLLKLLGTIKAMSSNYIMDDLSRLLVPSVIAFVKRIGHIVLEARKCGNESKLTEKEGEIFSFLDDLRKVTSDISSLESQLVQHPELTVIQYYIPAMVLHFEQLLASECSKILSSACAGEKIGRTFSALLVPTHEHSVSTLCPLDPKENDYNASCPLRIRIPISLMYDPWTVSHMLCHEVAHYCGDEYRLREKRKEALCECVAIYIVKRWHSFIGLSEIIQKDDYGATSCIYRIKKELERAIEPGYYHLEYVKVDIADIAERILLRYDWFEAYQVKVFSASTMQDRLESMNHAVDTFLDPIQIKQELKALSYAIDDIVSVCKESYADIAMLILFDREITDYYECIYKQEFLRVKKQYESQMKTVDGWTEGREVQAHFNRFALTVFTMAADKKPGSKEDAWSIDRIEDKGIGEEVKRVLQSKIFALNENNKDNKYIILYDILYDYLRKCKEGLMELAGNNSEELKELSIALESAKDESFDWSKIQKFIREKEQKGVGQDPNPE